MPLTREVIILQTSGKGNTSKTKTLIPVLESFQKKFEPDKPIVIADAALLSQKNIDALIEEGYQYILGGRLKNESDAIKSRIPGMNIREGHPVQWQHPNGRLIYEPSGGEAGCCKCRQSALQ